MADTRKDWTRVELEDVECLKAFVKNGVTTALLIQYEDKQECVPYSLVDEDSEVYREGDKGTLIIPYWLAVEKGLV